MTKMTLHDSVTYTIQRTNKQPIRNQPTRTSHVEELDLVNKNNKRTQKKGVKSVREQYQDQKSINSVESHTQVKVEKKKGAWIVLVHDVYDQHTSILMVLPWGASKPDTHNFIYRAQKWSHTCISPQYQFFHNDNAIIMIIIIIHW